MAFYVAPSARRFLDEATYRWPNRLRTGDGTIGDARHQAKGSASDHNPKADGHGGMVVDAADLTHDPAHGVDAHFLARQIAARGDPRVKYLISDRQIWNPSVAPGWRPYTGSDPHTGHVHLSVKPTDAARGDLSPWFGQPIIYETGPPLEVDVQITPVHITVPLDPQGSGNIKVEYPIDRIIGFLPWSETRPNADGRYDQPVNTVTFTPEGEGTIVVAQNGVPLGQAHVWLRVAS